MPNNQNIEFDWFTTVSGGQLGLHRENYSIQYINGIDVNIVPLVNSKDVFRVNIDKNRYALRGQSGVIGNADH